MKWIGLIVAIVAPFLAPLPGVTAARAQTCSANFSSVSFGANIDVLPGAAIDSAGNMTISCSGFGSGQTRQALVCVGLSNGLYSGGAPRRMSSGPASLAYDLYTDNARTNRWSATSSTDPSFLLSGATPSTSVPVYGRIVAGQSATPVGSYLDSITPYIAFAFFNGFGNQPTCAGLTNFAQQPSFQVGATVTANCSISASSLSFPNRSSLAANTDAQSGIAITCTTNAPYWVALDGGTAGATNPAARKMSFGAQSVTYGLYRDPARANAWGSTQYVNTTQGSGSATATNFIVYGRIPPQSTPPPGTYRDTVSVMVNF